MLSDNTAPMSGSAAARNDIRPASGKTSAAWLTGEVALYVGIGLAALGLRLLSLGDRPMDPAEADQALAAWQVVSGQGVHAAGYSPLLLLGNVLTFLLFGASDFAARLTPVLFGTALVLSPVFYRRWLGRWGALMAAAFLAVSPTSLYYSRHLSPEIAVAACALLVLGFKMRFLDTGNVRWLDAVVIAFALLLTSGPGAYSFLAVALVFGIIILVAGRMGYRGDEWVLVGDARRVLGEHKGIEGRLLLIFALTVLLVGTCLLMYIPGFQAVIDQFSAWTGQFGSQEGGLAWFQHLLLALIYEPLILLFAVAGIVLAFKNRNFLTSFLVFWGVVVLYGYTLVGGKTPGDLLLALAPLALLGGLAAGSMLESTGRFGSWEVEGLFVGITAPIVVYLVLQAGAYGRTGQMPYVWLFAIGSVLLVGLLAGYLFWLGPQATGRSLGILLLIFLGLVTWGTTWHLNYVHVSDPREIMADRPTHAGVRDMFATLEQMSSWRSGEWRDLPVSVVGLDDPVIRWYLRDFRDVRYEGAVAQNPETQVYIVPLSLADPALEESYRGEVFPLRTSWHLGLQGIDLINWLLYRTAPLPEPESIVFWAKGGGGLGAAAR